MAAATTAREWGLITVLTDAAELAVEHKPAWDPNEPIVLRYGEKLDRWTADGRAREAGGYRRRRSTRAGSA
ncbi:hypothetical protein [Pengzhenrongella sp.]|uniref:hypothetical protein n=1 Tax=Pengzhenrongella sp. TaxID=2888820 RepID=UPI002F9344EF